MNTVKVEIHFVSGKSTTIEVLADDPSKALEKFQAFEGIHVDNTTEQIMNLGKVERVQVVK
ncbi:hypothetical protein [Alkalicoccus halolimnae]|jgi:hypothetical protein|uniref:Uncharacterized protein n=1 Tax=Alkalicoccus halolimnae TaxID=1667239 RepID=A0A5C7FFA2_9BACI|nr:hypothetical protein [Alkalicoccus halolimnae]TXF84645.1 hypothetical protein FTX54_10620 [Alkalicoccus halolimnae]